MLFKIKHKPMQPLSGASHFVFAVCAGAYYSCRFVYSSALVYASSLQNFLVHRTLRLSPHVSGTIIMALCSMVWDWLVLRKEKMLFCWPNLLCLFGYHYILFCLYSMMGCFHPLLRFALLTLFNSNNNKNYNYNN